jgi:membrane glycosyltransferase
VGQENDVPEAVHASGAGGGLASMDVQGLRSPAAAPLMMFSPGHVRALVKDVLGHLSKWAPPRQNDTPPPPLQFLRLDRTLLISFLSIVCL